MISRVRDMISRCRARRILARELELAFRSAARDDRAFGYGDVKSQMRSVADRLEEALESGLPEQEVVVRALEALDGLPPILRRTALAEVDKVLGGGQAA